MWPYWIMFCTLAFPAIAARAYPQRTASLLLAGVLLALFVGLRFEVGGDWVQYLVKFQFVQGLPIERVFLESDPGFALLNWLVGHAGLGYYSANFLGGLIFVAGLIAFARHQPEPWVALTVAFPYLVLVVGMGYARQGIAVGFILMSLVALNERKFIPYLVYIALATLFHKTALIMIPLGFFLFGRGWLLCVLPFAAMQWEVLACLFVVMLTGYLDDASDHPWGELRKGLLDLLLAAMTSLALCQGRPVTMWWPLLKSAAPDGGIVVPVWAFVIISSAVLWISINATNCSDGIDGLAGSLTLLSLANLGGFLYVVVGHVVVAKYLILPHNPDGARWAILIATSSGAFAGYLWHNAKPSEVLMGDAGSRFLGMLIGVAVIAAGNPFLILVVAPMILLNGASGLGKLVVLRVMRRLGFDTTSPERRAANGATAPQHVVVRLLHSVRFPFHDHCRRNLHWSDPQVLVRFMLLQTFLTPFLLVLMVKVR
jgi:phospho-N-acetylmuramoyl-pentapeptide-transferase